MAAWKRAGRPVELGWHPALTIDRPILPPERVPSLVDASGRFRPLGRFLRRVALGRLCSSEVAAELAAQYDRFRELAGAPPVLVNSHQHVSLFRPVTGALHRLLASKVERPFVRRVREPWRLLAAGIDASASTPAQLQDRIAHDIVRWSEVVKKARIAVE